MKKNNIVGSLFVLSLFVGSACMADDIVYDTSWASFDGEDKSWSTASNWTNGVPTSTQNAEIYNTTPYDEAVAYTILTSTDITLDTLQIISQTMATGSGVQYTSLNADSGTTVNLTLDSLYASGAVGINYGSAGTMNITVAYAELGGTGWGQTRIGNYSVANTTFNVTDTLYVKTSFVSLWNLYDSTINTLKIASGATLSVGPNSIITVNYLGSQDTPEVGTITLSSSTLTLGEAYFAGKLEAKSNSKIIVDGNFVFTGTQSTSTADSSIEVSSTGKLTATDLTGFDLDISGTLKVGGSSLSADTITFQDGSILEISLEQLSATDTLLDMELLTSSATVELAFSEALTNGAYYEVSLFNDGTDIGDLFFESDWFDDCTYDSITGNLSFTAVPEPSTYALIFGALALGLVAYKRRK